MRRAYLIVAATVAVLTCLSWVASVRFSEASFLPMQWGIDGRPTWYAPKWMALSFGPMIGCFVMASILITRRYDHDGARAVRDLLPAIVIVTGGQAFYLFVLLTRAAA
ncbi:hypothetical protein [Methylobacterium sp. Leaf89]|uniref:hypothetical protein n=1 Tax=Methylobacterium sp. Leaf89 TaxID=1736245 RepID=UPI0006F90AC0|nr:hypothetical protein [Methylobacterium sp. Leaf89]KQO71604.1 hypothetical protein ASF18_20700 [Methylobacterium sp. Leaf89]